MKSNFFTKLAWRNIRSNRQLYVPYIVSSILTVAMFMMMASLVTNDFVNDRSSTLMQLFAMGTVVIGLFSLVFIFYTNSFLMKRRKKELGLYSLLGLEKKHVARVLGMETVIAGGISVAAGIVTGVVFGQLSFLFLNYLLQMPVAMGYEVSWLMAGVTAVLFIGIFFLTMIYNIAQVTLANPIRLLKGANEGEKEPKSSPLLFVIGLVSLIAGYAISVTIDDPVSALMQFFLAVLLVIVGTYLLFTAGSIIVLKALKKNKRLYYQPGPFIAISGMLYRMKQHAVGLANISILSVMVIIAVSTTVTLFVGTEETLNNRFPEENAISVLTNPGLTGEELSENITAMYEWISERTNDAGYDIKNPLSLRSAELSGYVEGNEFHHHNSGLGGGLPMLVNVIPLEDYNRVMETNVSLDDNELLIQEVGIELSSDTLSIGGETYEVNELTELPSFMDATANLLDTLIVVAPDVQTVDEMLNYYHTDPDQYGPTWSADVYWATNGAEEEKIAYADMMANFIYDKDIDLEVGMFYNSRAGNRQEFYNLNGGFLFLGIFLGGLFTLGTVLITYFKQVSEGYDDRERIQIMQKVGLDKETTRQVTRAQIVWMFTLPILTAALHTAFAYPIIQKLLVLFGVTSHSLLILCTLGVVLAFAAIYWIIYRITSKVYLNIVE